MDHQVEYKSIHYHGYVIMIEDSIDGDCFVQCGIHHVGDCIDEKDAKELIDHLNAETGE